jgi:hypothetical protein
MDTTTYLQDHLEAYRCGDRDRAFFGLINRGDSLLPDLVKAFQSEADPKVRAFIVEVLWQQRDQRAIPALADALNDPDDRVWQEALNGLVTLASTESVEALKMARGGIFRTVGERDKFNTWLEEAIEQAEEALRR